MADNVVLLEPGDEQAQKIAKAMGSQTASEILRFLSDGQKTLTDISEHLVIPMTTAKYHVENLSDAGLLSVSETKYSVKGREVKYYSLTNQLLIVAPRQSNVRSLLLKYASLFGIVAFGSVVIAIMSPLFGSVSGMRSTSNAVPLMAVHESGGAYVKAVADGYVANATMTPDMMVVGKGAAEMTTANFSPAPDTVFTLTQIPKDPSISSFFMITDSTLAFFLAGTLVICVLLCYEAYLWKRR